MYKIIVFIFVLVAFSCEREVNDSGHGKIVVHIPQYTIVERAITDVTSFASGVPPMTTAEVDCVGFLVSGPEESMRHTKCSLLNGLTGAADGELFFAKAYAGFYAGQTAELEVPSGTNRRITALGFKTNLTVAQGAESACRTLLTQEHNAMSKPFVFATSSTFNVEPGSTQSVVLPINFVANSTPFVGDCVGPGAPSNGGNNQGGPPTKMRMRFQDNLTSLNVNSCVGVIFELLDANGNRPTLAENFSFSVSDVSGGSDFWTLDRTYCTGSTGMTSPTINFFSGGTFHPSVILFSKTYPTPTTLNFTVVQSAGSTLSVDKPIGVNTLNYGTPSTEGPFTMNIFDIHSFRSTHSSSASNPIKVKSGECRPAVVQILDNLGRPVKAGNSSSTNSYTSTVGVVSGSVGITLSGACAGLVSTDPLVVGALSYDYLLNKFYYQVPSGSAGQTFKLGTSLSGIGYYSLTETLYPVDPTAGVNFSTFWKAD